MRRKRLRAISVILMCAIWSTMLSMPVTANETGRSAFVPNPQTEYARRFIEACNGQQWFMDLVESTLNISARSINTLRNRNDLDIIVSLASNRPTNGSLPPAIGEFAQLRYLFLGGLGLTGSIPTELYGCRNLENIDLSGNMLTGVISPDIANLTRLRVLLLHDNRLTGTIPTALPALENLDLANNQLTGGIPASVLNTRTLTVLALSNNPLGGVIPNGISALTNLRVLLAWNCELTGTIPDSLGNLASLQALDISGNNFSGAIPDSLSGLRNLERFAASDSGLSGAIPNGLSNLTNLAVLDLSNNSIVGAIPQTFSALTNLRTLILDNNALSGSIPDIWSGLSGAERIWLRGNRFAGDIPASLVMRQTTGADVRIDDNYLSGQNSAAIVSNARNFISEQTQGYQLRLRMNEYTQIRLGTRLNVFSAFTINRADTDEVVVKEKLPIANYTVTLVSELGNPDEYYRITSDSNGIYIELLRDIPRGEAIEFELRMLPVSASQYTFVNFTVGTEVAPSTQRPPILHPPSGSASPGHVPSEPDELDDESIPLGTIEHHAPYIMGFEDGRIGADLFMTREQAATILFRLADEPNTGNGMRFSDVSSARWSASAIAYVSSEGIMRGYDDSTFRPSGNITRAEFAAVLVRLNDYPQQAPTFADSIEHWAHEYIGAAEGVGLMRGYPDGSFRPNSFITRAEVMTTINRMLGRVPDRDRISEYENPFTDLSPTHWAYYEIMEATITHTAYYIDGTEVWQ